jgi:hypothetical protein
MRNVMASKALDLMANQKSAPSFGSACTTASMAHQITARKKGNGFLVSAIQHRNTIMILTIGKHFVAKHYPPFAVQ